MKKVIFTITAAIATIFGANAQSNIYVDVNALGNESGTSWGNAYTNIQDAIDNAASYDTIMIKSGTYKQQAIISKEVNIYGGFNGTETSQSQADPIANPVIFDADLNGDDVLYDYQTNRAENFPWHFNIFGNGVLSFYVYVEGITFKNAYNSGNSGSSIIIDALDYAYAINTTFKNCKWLQNCNSHANGNGGVIGAQAINTGINSLYIDKCWFQGNAKTGTGGSGSVIFSYSYGSESLSHLYVTNSVFMGNTDMGSSGSNCVIYQAVSSTASTNTENNSVIRNNTFPGNYGNPYAMRLWNGTSGELNCIFDRNIVTQGDKTMIIGDLATANNTYNVSVNNNYIPDNSITASIGFGYVNNIIGTTPGFVDPSNFDFNLTASSPCLDVESTLNWLPDNFDYAGNPRLSAMGVDIGAYEYQGTADINNATKDLELSIYPNPTNASLNLQVKESTKIKIVNLFGATVAAHQLDMGNNNINVSDLSSGIYYIQTENGSTINLIKQ